MEKILIVEDDENLGTSLQKYISGEGYDAQLCPTLESARETFNSDSNYALVVLDWMLPDGQGIDFLREVRTQKNNLPVIMLTARTELIDKVIGLESGADDYITKPFEPRELIARLRVQLRHKGQHGSASDKAYEQETLTLGPLVIDVSQREVTFEDKPIEMTKMEFDFLKLLAESPNRAFSREEILNKVWGYENYPSTRTVDTHVLQIRQKLKDEWIETVRGIGYRLRYKAKD